MGMKIIKIRFNDDMRLTILVGYKVLFGQEKKHIWKFFELIMAKWEVKPLIVAK